MCCSALLPLPPAQCFAPVHHSAAAARSTSCWDDSHTSSSPYPGRVPLSCCPPPRAPRTPEPPPAATSLPPLLAPVRTHSTPPGLKHALNDRSVILFTHFPHCFSTAFPFPELTSSPDLRRHHCPPSSATLTASEPQSSAARAPQ
jgi:hypothetical protein